MSGKQQRHYRNASGCGAPQSLYCSRPVEQTLASCFDIPGPGLGCGQMTRGPVDVEDLASFCNFSSQPQANYAPAQQNRCNYAQQQPTQVQALEVSKPYFDPANVEEAVLAYCTDSRWMACPATSYCPVYNVPEQPLESWHVLPCAQDFCNYYDLNYIAEDDVLEEYLCVLDILVLIARD